MQCIFKNYTLLHSPAFFRINVVSGVECLSVNMSSFSLHSQVTLTRILRVILPQEDFIYGDVPYIISP